LTALSAQSKFGKSDEGWEENQNITLMIKSAGIQL